MCGFFPPHTMADSENSLEDQKETMVQEWLEGVKPSPEQSKVNIHKKLAMEGVKVNRPHGV